MEDLFEKLWFPVVLIATGFWVWYLNPLSGWDMWKVVLTWGAGGIFIPLFGAAMYSGSGKEGAGFVGLAAALLLIGPILLAMMFFLARNALGGIGSLFA
jgi:hypothetical protein